MIEFRPFVSFVIANCEDKFRRHDITVDTADTDLDLIAAGILDSFDLLNLAMALEDQHRLTMDFSVFTSDFDASFKGLYSCLTPEAGAPEPSPPPMPDQMHWAAQWLTKPRMPATFSTRMIRSAALPKSSITAIPKALPNG